MVEEEVKGEGAVGSTQESREVPLTLEASANPESTNRFRSSSVTGRTGRTAGLGDVASSTLRSGNQIKRETRFLSLY